MQFRQQHLTQTVSFAHAVWNSIIYLNVSNCLLLKVVICTRESSALQRFTIRWSLVHVLADLLSFFTACEVDHCAADVMHTQAAVHAQLVFQDQARQIYR